MEAVLLVGIPGAGKTTYYRQRFAETHAHVSLDELRTRARESRTVANLLAAGKPFVVDNTNVRAVDRAPYIAAARAAAFRVAGYFLAAELREAIARNAKRADRKVPVPAIVRAWKRLERPSYDEGFDELFTIRVSDHDFHLEPMPYVD